MVVGTAQLLGQLLNASYSEIVISDAREIQMLQYDNEMQEYELLANISKIMQDARHLGISSIPLITTNGLKTDLQNFYSLKRQIIEKIKLQALDMDVKKFDAIRSMFSKESAFDLNALLGDNIEPLKNKGAK